MCVYSNPLCSGDVDIQFRRDGFLVKEGTHSANTSSPLFSDNTFPKVFLCELNKPCSFALPVDSKRTEIPNVQHGHVDPGLVVQPIRVWNKQPFICDSSHARCPYEAMITVIPSAEKAYQYCVQTTDEDMVNADERCFIIQGVQANLMSTSSHFNYPPTLPNNATMSCPRNVTCHYTVEFQRHGGTCHPPRFVQTSNMSIKVTETAVKQLACMYDVQYTPSMQARGNKTVCVAINTSMSTVERHCVNVEVTPKTVSQLAGPCSLVYCVMGSFCDSLDGMSRCLCQPGFVGQKCDRPVACSVSFPSSVTCPPKDCHVTGIAIGTQKVTSSGNLVTVHKDANDGRVNIVQIQRSSNDSEICFHVNESNCHSNACIAVIPDNQYQLPTRLPGRFTSNNLTYNCNTERNCYITVTTYPVSNTTCAEVTIHPNTTVTNHRVFPPTLDSATCTTTIAVTGTTKAGENQQLCLQTTSDVKCIEITVKDFEKCSSSPCENGGTCEALLSGYNCLCGAGWTDRNCSTNIDECISNPCHLGTCIDGINNYRCSCSAGYTGQHCETDIDECSPDPCINGTCVDGINNYTCTCDVGFSGRNCDTNTDDCLSAPCQNGGTCLDGVNKYYCQCQLGFTGSNCEMDIDECSSNPCVAGTCIDGINNYTCTCDAGFSGHDCGKDIDECSPSPCVNGRCIDGISDYTCTCDAGFSGHNCDTDIDECLPAPCQNGGTCWDDVSKYVCQCVLGYTGRNCEIDINECLSDPCLNGATCTDLVNNYTCSCVSGVTGRFCETRLAYCHQGDCLNGGTCVNGTCQCRAGYTGEHCHLYLDPCHPSPCLRGSCYHHATDFYCDCSAGYTGKMCEVSINQCATNPCVNGGICNNALDNYTCTCLPGFTGQRCQTDINDCALNPCMHGGLCIDKMNSFTCLCQHGYSGDICQTVTDFCIQQPCLRGTCFSSATDYHCVCPPGYTGKTCNITVMAIEGPDHVNITVPKGSDIFMNCSVTGQPTSYGWAKMNGCDGPHITAAGSKLQIQDAKRGDAGIYTCTASNGQGLNVTKTFQVKLITNQSEICVFERNTTCSWNQMDSTADDKFDWTPQSGSTQSSGTGPDTDHTTGSNKGTYMYIEASSPRLQGDNASLLSERLPANQTVCLEFWYYMYGDGIGNLTVNLEDSCSHTETEVFKRSGEQGEQWRKASVTIPANIVPNDYTVKLTGDVGPTFRGDTAIDDLSLRDGSCTNTQKSAGVALVG